MSNCEENKEFIAKILLEGNIGDIILEALKNDCGIVMIRYDGQSYPFGQAFNYKDSEGKKKLDENLARAYKLYKGRSSLYIKNDKGKIEDESSECKFGWQSLKKQEPFSD